MTENETFLPSKSTELFLFTSLIDDVLPFVNIDVGVLQRFIHSESDVRQGKIIVLQSADFSLLLVLLFAETLQRERERRENSEAWTSESRRTSFIFVIVVSNICASRCFFASNAASLEHDKYS